MLNIPANFYTKVLKSCSCADTEYDELGRIIAEAIARINSIYTKKLQLRDELNKLRTKFNEDSKRLDSELAALQSQCQHEIQQHHYNRDPSGGSDHEDWSECLICQKIVK